MKLTKDQEAALRYADGEKGIDHMNIQIAAFAAGCKFAREQINSATQEIPWDGADDNSIEMVFGEGDKSIFLQGHRIGTCGEPIDKLKIKIGRTRAVPDLIVGFDGVRNGWTIGGSFRTADGQDFEFREVAFVHEDQLDDDHPPKCSKTVLEWIAVTDRLPPEDMPVLVF